MARSDDCLSCVGICCACIGGLALAAGAVSILVFSIMGLVQDWDLAKDCDGSNLHIYMIVALVLSFISGGNSSTAAKTDNSVARICAMGTSLALSIAMMVWGYVEIFDNSCSDLEHSLLWDMGIVIASLHAFIVLLSILVVCFAACCS